MAFLYKHLRVNQVFGANTDAGKTLITAALCRADSLKSRDKQVFYLKPVSTGPLKDADDHFVNRYGGSNKGALRVDCLYRYDEPVSPHLAARMSTAQGRSQSTVPSNSEFIQSIKAYVSERAKDSYKQGSMYIETAGGVHSPTLSGLTQVDAYRDLLLPTILIGDSRLGGISSTISAFESLHIRGYTIDQIILFSDTYYRNWEYLTEFFREKGIDVTAIPPPPQKLQDVRADREALEGYYRSISDGQESQASVALSVVNRLDDLHARRIETIQSMPGRAIDSFWYPFVQHGRIKSESDITVIDSAHGDFFSTYNASSSDQSPPPVVPEASKSMLQPRFDGSASWWTQAVGHADPSLTLAAAHAAGRYGHVIFPLAVHEPALALAERLIQNGPGKGWASRVFFSDNGTIGCELALKMALRASALRYGRRKELGVIGIRGSYHGDTIGAMDACDGGPFSAAVEWYRGRGFWFDPPQIGIRNGQAVVSCTSDTWKRGDFDVDDRSHVKWGGSNGANSWHHTTSSLSELYDVESRLSSPLARIYRRHICKTLERLIDEGLAFGALIIEPLVMGAAGMIFVDPLFQRVLVDVVRESEDLFSRNNTLRQSSPTPSGAEWTGLPIIFDEVFVGLYRLGHMTCSSVLGTRPDVSVLAKILTGGLLPMAVTLSSSSIFNAFLGPDKIDALLHGHSYTAHPIGCAVANAALDITEGISQGDAWSEAKRKWESKPWVRGTKNSHPLNAWSLWDADFVNDISRLGGIQEVMTLGTVLAIRLEDSTTGYLADSAEEFVSSIRRHSSAGGSVFDIHARTLGNVAYFMSSLNTPSDILRSLEEMILGSAKQRLA